MKSLAVVVFLLAALAGCGGETASPETIPSDAELQMGRDLFEARVIGANPGCVTCHSLDEGVVLVGPSLYDLATRAPSQVEGQSAGQYVTESIVDPDAFIVPGYSEGQMVGSFEDSLTPAQVESLVNFLLGI